MKKIGMLGLHSAGLIMAMQMGHAMTMRERSRSLGDEPAVTNQLPPEEYQIATWREEADARQRAFEEERERRRISADAHGKAALMAAEAKRARKNAQRLANSNQAPTP